MSLDPAKSLETSGQKCHLLVPYASVENHCLVSGCQNIPHTPVFSKLSRIRIECLLFYDIKHEIMLTYVRV